MKNILRFLFRHRRKIATVARLLWQRSDVIINRLEFVAGAYRVVRQQRNKLEAKGYTVAKLEDELSEMVEVDPESKRLIYGSLTDTEKLDALDRLVNDPERVVN